MIDYAGRLDEQIFVIYVAFPREGTSVILYWQFIL